MAKDKVRVQFWLICNHILNQQLNQIKAKWLELLIQHHPEMVVSQEAVNNLVIYKIKSGQAQIMISRAFIQALNLKVPKQPPNASVRAFNKISRRKNKKA